MKRRVRILVLFCCVLLASHGEPPPMFGSAYASERFQEGRGTPDIYKVEFSFPLEIRGQRLSGFWSDIMTLGVPLGETPPCIWMEWNPTGIVCIADFSMPDSATNRIKMVEGIGPPIFISGEVPTIGDLLARVAEQWKGTLEVSPDRIRLFVPCEYVLSLGGIEHSLESGVETYRGQARDDHAFGTRTWREMLTAVGDLLSDDPAVAAAQCNAAANELSSLPALPDGVVGDLARMFRSPAEDEVWRDYCLQFLGSALERTDGVTDADRVLARGTLVEALSSTNATFAGTALRAFHRRGDPSDPLVASNALRIARDPTYPSSSRTTALLVLEDCAPATTSPSPTLAETATAVSADPSASPGLRQTADAVLKRLAAATPNP